MAKVFPIQTNFTAGQLSPRLHGRVDINKYNNGLKTQKNAYSLPHGGVVRRGGFRFVARAGSFDTATITVTDYANISVGTTISLTKLDGATVVFTSEAISGSAPSETNGWRPNESNDTTADNIYTAINAHADFTVANPSANIVTVVDDSTGSGSLVAASSDGTRLAIAHPNQGKVRLVRFEFSVTQAYILEFGDLYIRFYKDNGRIESGDSPVLITTTFTEA